MIPGARRRAEADPGQRGLPESDTAWWRGLPDAERAALFAQFASATSVERIGSADDVARAIVSLIDNDFITGTIVTVDGGAHARRRRLNEA